MMLHRWIGRMGLAAVVASGLGPAAAAAQNPARFVGAVTSSRQAQDRQAQDRRADEGSRQTRATRQTDTPKGADSPNAANARSESNPKPAFERQPEPSRQAEPRPQPAPRRQAEPARQNDNGQWRGPGPAWRSLGPAWRDLNDRPGVVRPGEDAFRATPNTYAPGSGSQHQDRDRRRGPSGHSNTTVYVPYPYPVPYDYAPYYPSQLQAEPPVAPPAPSAPEQPLGFLTLRVQPRTADVFVDGVFAGTVDDFGGRSARMLAAGPRRVELVAPGYETLTFDVRVPENDTVTFTRDLEPMVERPTPEPISIPHKAMYIVPRCYIGDRPPLLGDMPAGCSLDDVRVIP